jgi:hypothetical protein
MMLGVGGVLLIEGAGVMAAHALGLLPPPALPDRLDLWAVVNDGYRAYWALWSGGVALATLGALAVWASLRRSRWLGPTLVATVLVVDLWRLLLPVNPSGPAAYYYPETSFLRQTQAAVPPTERLLVIGDNLLPNTSLIYGLRDWRSQDTLMSERAYRAAALIDPEMPKNVWTDYNMFLFHPRLRIAALLGMRYFAFPTITDPNYPAQREPDQPAFRRLAFKDGLGLWEAEGVPGFAYLSDTVDAVADGKAAEAWLAARTWTQVRAYPAVVEAPVGAISVIRHDAAGGSPGSTMVQAYTPGRIALQVTAARPALLVVAESWYPGWRATLDGQPVDILRTNYLSQGVVVPAGMHTVELRYQPDAFTLGAAISGLGLLALLGLALWAWWPRRPASRTVAAAAT